ncbi:MAG: helix-turn-helix transcriptional regulator [Alphaproteobacteria bacterium]
MSGDANEVLTIGAKIRELRLARAWNQEELADRANISLSTLRSIELEKNRPRTLTIQKIAQACKVDPTELMSLPWHPPGFNSNIGEKFEQSAARRDDVAKPVHQIARIIKMLNRQGDMQTIAGAMFAGTIGQEDALRSIQCGLEGRKVGGEVAAWARHQVAILNRLDIHTGGKQLYEAALSNLTLLQTLLQTRAASSQDEQDLQLALAQTASQAGWFAEDAEQLDLAAQHYHFGIEMARTAGNKDYAVYCMSRLAAVALANGHPRQCLSRLECAETEAGNPSPFHSFILTFAVEALGKLGDFQTAKRTLAKADTLYDKRNTDHVPKWLFWLMRPSFTVIAGRTFISHDPRFAAKLSENAIAHTPAGFTRHRLHLKAGLAKAKLALGEMDEAVSHAAEVLQGIADNSMPRVEKLISEFNAQLPDDPVTLDFKKRFAAYKRTLNV